MGKANKTGECDKSENDKSLKVKKKLFEILYEKCM